MNISYRFRLLHGYVTTLLIQELILHVHGQWSKMHNHSPNKGRALSLKEFPWTVSQSKATVPSYRLQRGPIPNGCPTGLLLYPSCFWSVVEYVHVAAPLLEDTDFLTFVPADHHHLGATRAAVENFCGIYWGAAVGTFHCFLLGLC